MLLREALECQAARLYCGEQIKNNKSRLIVLAETLEKNITSARDRWLNELKFHNELICLSKCGSLKKVYQNTMTLRYFSSLQLFHFYSEENLKNRSNHVELVESLCVDSPSRAENLIREHIRYGKPKVLGNLKIIGEKSWNQI